MFSVLLIIQVLLGLSLIVLILLQHGKGADMGAAFGSGASGTVFGSRGAGSFLTRTTAILAAAFFVNSILLSSPLILGREDVNISVTEQVLPSAAEDTLDQEVPVVDVPPTDLPDIPADAAESTDPVNTEAPGDLPE